MFLREQNLLESFSLYRTLYWDPKDENSEEFDWDSEWDLAFAQLRAILARDSLGWWIETGNWPTVVEDELSEYAEWAEGVAQRLPEYLN